MTRPTACSAGSDARTRAADLVQLVRRHDDLLVSGDLEHRVLTGVDDQRAGLRSVLAGRNRSIASIPLYGRLQITPRPLTTRRSRPRRRESRSGRSGAPRGGRRPSAPSGRPSSPCPARAGAAVRGAPASSPAARPRARRSTPGRGARASAARGPRPRGPGARACSCPVSPYAAASGSAPTPHASSTTTNARLMAAHG